MILIIGSKGFIGSHLLNFFLKSERDVLHADVATDYTSNNYLKISDASIDFARLFADFDISFCINASGAASVPESIENPHMDFQLNAINVHHILEAIRRFRPVCKLINLSSAAVYGNPISQPVSENHPTQPISPYGYHKLMSELLCAEYARLFGLRTCSVRIFSAYGEGLTKQLFWDLHRKTTQSGSVILFGTGLEKRDFIHVSDVCRGLELIERQGSFHGDCYNLASGTSVAIKSAVDIFIRNIGWKGELSFKGDSRIGDPTHWEADLTKLKSLGFEPIVGLEQGLRRYAEWLKEKE